MTEWIFLLGMLFAGCCSMAGYRAGQNAAARKYFQMQEQENAKMDEIQHRYAGAGRDELLSQLRNGSDK